MVASCPAATPSWEAQAPTTEVNCDVHTCVQISGKHMEPGSGGHTFYPLGTVSLAPQPTRLDPAWLQAQLYPTLKPGNGPSLGGGDTHNHDKARQMPGTSVCF
jgi:hypothetical protein